MHIRNTKKSANDISLQDVIKADREGNEVRIEDNLADEKENVEEIVGSEMQVSRLHEVVREVLKGRERTVI
jgi:DNA-directed RNA polymerase specialized sigma subunit